MANIENFKRGDTFSLTASLKDESGDPLVLALANIKSQVRTASGNLMADIVIAETETAGTYLLTVEDTNDWPAPATLLMDIQMDISGHIRSSDVITISVVKDVTR